MPPRPDVGIARHDQRARDRRRQQDGLRHHRRRRGDTGEEGHRASGKLCCSHRIRSLNAADHS